METQGSSQGSSFCMDSSKKKNFNYMLAAILRGILSVKKLLMENIKYQDGTWERILFWKDQWARDRTLAAQFPDLFNCAMDKDAKVKSYMSRIGDKVVWSLILRRHLKDQEETQFISPQSS